MSTFQQRVSVSDNDAEEAVSGGAIQLASSDLEILHDTGAEQLVGVRFTSVTVGRYATINSATLTFQVDVAHSGDVTVDVYCEDADSGAIFTTGTSNISSRTLTTSVVSWAVGGDGSAADTNVVSADLSTIVQEVVDRTGWSSGNNLVFVIKNPSSTNFREFESWDGENAAAPLLDIDYTENTAPTVVLNSPADTSSTGDLTPVLDFTGTDSDSDDVRYNIQIDTVSTFNSQDETNTVGTSGSAVATSIATVSTLSTTSKFIAFLGNHQGTMSACTLDGVALTKMATSATAFNETAEIWYLDNPGVKTNVTLAGTFSGGSGRVVGYICLEGTKDGVEDVEATANGTSTTASVSITPSVNNSIILACAYAEENLTVGSGETSIFSQTGASYENFDASYVIQGTAAAQTMDFSVASSQRWAIAAVAIAPGTAPLIDKLSGTDVGFANPDVGGDTDPFTSGDNIQYTVQSDLTASTTYYWRVRGIDPNASNTYGAWATTRSFVATSGTTTSTSTSTSTTSSSSSTSTTSSSSSTSTTSSSSSTSTTTTSSSSSTSTTTTLANFPSPGTQVDTDFASSVTSMPVNMPATVNSGDLLISLVEVRNAGTWTKPSGWSDITTLSQAGGGSVGKLNGFYKIADGTEDGTTPTWTASTLTTGAWQTIRVTNWHGTTPPEAVTSSGDSTSADPPSVTASWGSDYNLWIVVAGHSAASTAAFTAAPTNYTNFSNNGASSGGSACSIATAYRELSAATEDPGTFTAGGSNRWWAAANIVVRPAASGTTTSTSTTSTSSSSTSTTSSSSSTSTTSSSSSTSTTSSSSSTSTTSSSSSTSTTSSSSSTSTTSSSSSTSTTSSSSSTSTTSSSTSSTSSSSSTSSTSSSSSTSTTSSSSSTSTTSSSSSTSTTSSSSSSTSSTSTSITGTTTSTSSSSSSTSSTSSSSSTSTTTTSSTSTTTTSSSSTSTTTTTCPPIEVDSFRPGSGFGATTTDALTLSGQSFTGNGGILYSAGARLWRVGSASYNIYAYIYAHTGTYGSTGKPTGAVLATSDAVVHSTLPTSVGWVEFIFSGANKINLDYGTYYVVQIGNNGADLSNNYNIETNQDAPATHSGNNSTSSDSGSNWNYLSNRDISFYVYVDCGSVTSTSTTSSSSSTTTTSSSSSSTSTTSSSTSTTSSSSSTSSTSSSSSTSTSSTSSSSSTSTTSSSSSTSSTSSSSSSSTSTTSSSSSSSTSTTSTSSSSSSSSTSTSSTSSSSSSSSSTSSTTSSSSTSTSTSTTVTIPLEFDIKGNHFGWEVREDSRGFSIKEDKIDLEVN